MKKSLATREESLMRVLAAVLVSVTLMAVAAFPAQAETTVKVRDSYNGDIPALNLKWGQFGYYPKVAFARIKMENLSKRNTRVVLKFSRPDGRTLQVDTKYRSGTRVTRGHLTTRTSHRRIHGGYSAHWNFAQDVITIKLTKRLKGQRAGFYVFSLPKGAMHGNYLGDDAYRGRVERG